MSALAPFAPHRRALPFTWLCPGWRTLGSRHHPSGYHLGQEVASDCGRRARERLSRPTPLDSSTKALSEPEGRATASRRMIARRASEGIQQRPAAALTRSEADTTM